MNTQPNLETAARECAEKCAKATSLMPLDAYAPVLTPIILEAMRGVVDDTKLTRCFYCHQHTGHSEFCPMIKQPLPPAPIDDTTPVQQATEWPDIIGGGQWSVEAEQARRDLEARGIAKVKPAEQACIDDNATPTDMAAATVVTWQKRHNMTGIIPRDVLDDLTRALLGDVRLATQEEDDTICRECGDAMEIRQGCESTGYCDECAQGMVAETAALRAQFEAATKERDEARQNNAVNVSLMDSRNAELTTTNARLRAALEQAAKMFREYEKLHRAKGTLEGAVKAESNAMQAENCEKALADSGHDPMAELREAYKMRDESLDAVVSALTDIETTFPEPWWVAGRPEELAEHIRGRFSVLRAKLEVCKGQAAIVEMVKAAAKLCYELKSDGGPLKCYEPAPRRKRKPKPDYEKYKRCSECGQPVLRKGQKRTHLDDYRHAQGCPNDDAPRRRKAKR